ncbi:hypothetical protein ABPG77_009643 [Micractinium sp. CCAP 211/92]
MGCCCSEPEDPLMEQYRRAKDFASKAQIILQLATKEEKCGRIVSAIQHYGTHLRCMAVHLFKEFDRKKKNEMLNVAQSCRRIYAHRAALAQRAMKAYPGGCCSDPYIPSDPAAPPMLAPWEWSEFLNMVKGSGCIEAALQKMGLLKIETKEAVATRIAEAGRSNMNVAVSNTNQVSPNISVNPTITGPTTTISGPSTNISGPNTTTTVSPNMNNAQTGEGNVAPATGTGSGTSGAGAASATATGGATPRSAQPAPQPGMQAMGMQPGMQPGYMMMPTPSGQWVMMPMSGSGDYAAAAAAAQQQQQQMMQMAASGGQAMFMPAGGMVGGAMGGMAPPGAMPYMMPAHSGGYYPMPGMPHMAPGAPVAGAPVTGFPPPAQGGFPAPPEGYPPPAKGVVPEVAA